MKTSSAMCRAGAAGPWLSIAVIVLSSLPVCSETVIPAGARLSVRLDSRVSSQHSRLGDSVSATLIAPVRLNGKELLPSGFAISGKLTEPGPAHKNSDHSVVRLGFGSLTGKSGRSLPFQAKVVSVDNARESVDGQGVIHGLRPLRRRPTEVEDILLLAAYAHPAVLASLEVSKLVVAEKEKPRVNYGPGTEMALALESPFRIVSLPAAETIRPVSVFPRTPAFQEVVNRLPLRTSTVHGVPSDLINCVFIGSPEALANAFASAGWMPAEKLDAKTDTLTFLAIAAHHSYHEGPVSSLVVGGEKPSFVFEKAANTFAKRHHIRMASRAGFCGSGSVDRGGNSRHRNRFLQKRKDVLPFGGGKHRRRASEDRGRSDFRWRCSRDGSGPTTVGAAVLSKCNRGSVAL